MFGQAFHLLWHTKRMKHRLYQKNCFSFPSLAIIFWLNVSSNHGNALTTNFAMTILAVSENQGVNTSIFDKNDFLHLCGPKFQNNFLEKETTICTQFRFLILHYL